MSPKLNSRRGFSFFGTGSTLLMTGALASAAPAGPTVQVPDGGAAPGPFPNTSVSAVNVIAKGSTTFNGSVDVSGFDGHGPIPWSLNRYNRGDFAIRLSPGDPVAALGVLGQGFGELADNAPSLPANQAWRPSPSFGVIIPTVRQNGPINWNDGEGPFFPTIALSEASSGPGYDMGNGAFAAGNVDINTGRAGTHDSSPEANFGFSVAWFPYDQGWLGGEIGSPDATTGASTWTSPTAHAAGLSAGLMKWTEFPEGSATYGGLGVLGLPGVKSNGDGMLFATSSDGESALNIVGVAPREDGNGWIVTIREDSATDAETLAGASQSEFQFVYVPFNARNLVGGYINGSDGARIAGTGTFTLTRTGTGTYELTLPGKTGQDGTLLLQAADLEPGTSVPMATRAFLSYEFKDGKFVIQSRITASDTTADLRDTDFYVAWVDFKTPLAMPDGPRLRAKAPVVVSGEGVIAREAGIAVNSDLAEILVTTIDSENTGGYTDPITQQSATAALVGRFYDAATLEAKGDPFVIVGNPTGSFSRHDVKYNPVSKQYVVVANARTYGNNGRALPLVALVKNSVDAGAGSPVAKAFVHDANSEYDYDDVAVAVSTANGNFILVAEYKFPDEGEGTVGVLFDRNGTALTPQFARLDPLQGPGDEDDPDVAYLPERDVFLYLSNTDNSNGSTGTLSNRVVGSIVDTAPDAQGKLVTRVEQILGDGQPAATREGHPSALLNPFNGQLIVAYDVGGDSQPNGDLSFIDIGPAPTYTFSRAQPDVPYLVGTGGNPLKHQHPQLAADTVHGVIVVGHNATGSEIGLPDAYVFKVLGSDGHPMPSALGTSYFLADSPGGLGTSANYHNVKFSPRTASFYAVFNSSPGVTYLASFEVTSDHLAVAAPTLSVTRTAQGIVLSWPASATGFTVETSPTVGTAAWSNSGLQPAVDGDLNKVTVPPTAAAAFYRLRK